MDIRSHPLAWRWTDPKRSLIPDSVLEKMRPLNETESSSLISQCLLLTPNGVFAEDKFLSLAEFSADQSTETVRDWLRNLGPQPSQKIFISWDSTTGLETTWEIFTSYWDDFCYPAADDVLVCPPSLEWALFYFHEELFQFGHPLPGSFNKG